MIKLIKNKFMLLFSIVLILLFTIPSAFALDNTTVDLQSDLNSTVLSDDVYFDANAVHDHGEGTSDSPYQQIRDARIEENSVIHLKNGEYELDNIKERNNISLIGENPTKTIINGNGGFLKVTNQLILKNVTICDLNIWNYGNILATNTIFTNSTAISEYGGAIYCQNAKTALYLTNCTFTNNYADCGGAIYMKGGVLQATDCVFINNTAYHYGGAVAAKVSDSIYPRLTFKKSKFINDTSLNDAGGAFYLESSNFKGEYLEFSSCHATFGGAMALLKSFTVLDKVYAFNNTAGYDGGVSYAIYGNFTLTDSDLIANHAKNGGGLFIDNAYYGWVVGNRFVNNSASLEAGAFYSLLNDYFKIDDNQYVNNTAMDADDLYEQKNLSLIFTSNNYTLYGYKNDGSVDLPSYYENSYTPVKNQGSGGNCWAFAALASLESSILKASGEKIDLSEENMKNIASLYSPYGWQMDTNDGGYDDMALGYLLSWLGPVLDCDDVYNEVSLTSPVLESILHVQNILFLKKSDNNNLNHIKRAIMDYGGVHSGIYMTPHYDSSINKYVQYYNGDLPCNHAVVLIGWDDNLYIPGAPGKGAWIVKNSWGESWGHKGLFYVSYYDTSCPKLGDSEGAFAFILNDTIKYDKNYQYDIAKTDYFFNTTPTVWYKNIFKATGNEYLAAVSTFFEKMTDYTYSVLVNDNLKITKSGKTNPGYYTFDLDEMIPLNIGDKFEIIFKITVDGDAGVPISESVSLNTQVYTENISFISYDGVHWRDFINIPWQYPDHTYESQVACIKAFTLLNPINTTLTVSVENRTYDSSDIIVEVLNQWGYPVSTGHIVLRFGDEEYSVKINNGIAKKKISLKSANLTVSFNQTGYIYNKKTLSVENPLLDSVITLNITGQYNPVNITATVLDENNSPVKHGYVIFSVEGVNYTEDVVDGVAKLSNINIEASEVEITAYYNDSFAYAPSNITKSILIKRLNTGLSLNIETGEANNPVNITALITDENNCPVKTGTVKFYLSDEKITANVADGRANIFYTFKNTGNNYIQAEYSDTYNYNPSSDYTSFSVSKMKTDLIFDTIIKDNNVVFLVYIKDCVKEFDIDFNFNGDTISNNSKNGLVVLEMNDLDYGTYNYNIQLHSTLYEADDIDGELKIDLKKTQLASSDYSVIYNGDYKVILKDINGNIVAGRVVYLTVDGQTYKKRTDNRGTAVFNIPIGSGQYSAVIKFAGDDEYVKSQIAAEISFESSIDFVSNTYSVNADYNVVLKDGNGNPIKNRIVNIVLNGASYNVVSDNYGQVSLKINLNPGNYLVKVTNPVTGEVQSQNINVVKRITGNSAITMYYGAGKIYKVRVCDDTGNFVSNLKVTFKINSRTYYSYTDKNGYASLKISQKPGTYTVTAVYKGVSVSNKVKVKTTLITKNIKVKKGKTIKFTVKLLNKYGKKLKNKKITFKFKGKTYKVKTNRKGIATLKITKKYKKGKYTITSKYGALKIKNKITIR